MRALFYSPKGAGHVNPTLPLVRALVERGHEVTYSLTSEWRAKLEAEHGHGRGVHHGGLQPWGAVLSPALARDGGAPPAPRRGGARDPARRRRLRFVRTVGVRGLGDPRRPGDLLGEHARLRPRRSEAEPGAPSERLDATNLAAITEIERRLFHGVPLVCVPHFGDQPQNAERVVAQGAGVLLPAAEISAARVAAEVERASGESFRANAARLATKLRACGGLERALRVIEGVT